MTEKGTKNNNKQTKKLYDVDHVVSAKLHVANADVFAVTSPFLPCPIPVGEIVNRAALVVLHPVIVAEHAADAVRFPFNLQ